MKTAAEFTLSEIEALLLMYPDAKARMSVLELRAYVEVTNYCIAQYKVQKTKELVANREKPQPRQRKARQAREEWEDVPCVLIKEEDGFSLLSQGQRE